MVTSKNNTFGYWLLTIIGYFFLLISLVGMVSYLLNINSATANKPEQEIFNMMAAFFGCFSILFLFIISLFIKKIAIDDASKTISFKNAFTKQTTTYNLSDFDGFVETYSKHKNSTTKTIGLVKAKKITHRIDSFWYSNYNELKGSIHTMIPLLP